MATRSIAGAPKVAPKWTLDLMGKHSLDFWLTSEDLPDPNNRVTINRDGEIVLQYKPNNEEGHKRLIKKLESSDASNRRKCPIHGHECHEGIFARNLYLGQRIPLAGVAHQNGTMRFGNDPKTSALDRNCKAHELDNLYVVDASFFCSSGAVNPGAHDNGQRAACRRSFAGTNARTRRRAGSDGCCLSCRRDRGSGR